MSLSPSPFIKVYLLRVWLVSCMHTDMDVSCMSVLQSIQNSVIEGLGYYDIILMPAILFLLTIIWLRAEFNTRTTKLLRYTIMPPFKMQCSTKTVGRKPCTSLQQIFYLRTRGLCWVYAIIAYCSHFDWVPVIVWHSTIPARQSNTVLM